MELICCFLKSANACNVADMATKCGEANPPTDDVEETPTADPTEQTPAKSAAGSKACSTPTSEGKPLPDLTLDASRISVLNR